MKNLNKSNNPLRDIASSGATEMETIANLETPFAIKKTQREVIPSGFFIELPKRCEAQIRPRRGRAIKQGTYNLHTSGTIDSVYRGEFKIILINLSKEDRLIHSDNCIDQMMAHWVEEAIWSETEKNTITQRNTGRFGYAGKN